ncbi:MAG: polysaccharide deacetylase family protein [Opitutaceae bacterium]|nr:polysaccharide deacetylase family protein [Cytophagales bacterium]
MPSATWQVKTLTKEIYLTFDDGPIPDVTEWVLDTLASFNIKATFFCVGDNIKKHPTIFSKIITSGHSIGNHTFNHLKGWKTSNQGYLENIELWEQTIKDLNFQLNNKPIFRPPYGQITFSQSKALKERYEIIMWDIITGDFDKNLDKQNCLEKCIKMTTAGTVIVFHDSLKAKENLQYILPFYIKSMIDKGFTFAKW